jgi:hypothetical protein
MSEFSSLLIALAAFLGLIIFVEVKVLKVVRLGKLNAAEIAFKKKSTPRM